MQAGTPIPTPFQSFTRNGINIRRGELALIAAAPGGGKSALTMFIAQNGDGKGGTIPTFYFSADSPASTVFQRSASMATGWELAEVERLLNDGCGADLEQRVNHATSHMQWSFKSTITPDYMMDELEAYAMVHGEWPQLIVVDNLMNMDMGTESEFDGLNDASFFLNDLARDTGAAVVALHHVAGEHESGERPIPLSGLRGKVSKLPSLVLTLSRCDGVKVSVVKNRSAQADPSGGLGVTLGADLGRMSFSG